MKAEAAGFTAFLRKPADMDRLEMVEAWRRHRLGRFLRRLAGDVQHLLLRFGIKATATELPPETLYVEETVRMEGPEVSTQVIGMAEKPLAAVRAKRDSSIVVGLGDNEFFVASDIPAILSHTRDVVFLGDEEMSRQGRVWEGTNYRSTLGTSGGVAQTSGGYTHIVDFTDVKHPVEVARYQVPEAGPHNFWIQNDTLYVAYYNAGLRVVDISGEQFIEGDRTHIDPVVGKVVAKRARNLIVQSEAFTGSREMSAQPMVEYFRPLLGWLRQQNQGRRCGW